MIDVEPLTAPRSTKGAVRALVVEDDPAISELLALVLKYEGWQVSVVHTGAAAITEASASRPDAVLLDVALPDMDGFEVLRRLRVDAQELPVIFVTACDSAADRAAGRALGCNGYLAKPFALDELIGILHLLADDPSDSQQPAESV